MIKIMKTLSVVFMSFLATTFIVACGKTQSKKANLNRSGAAKVTVTDKKSGDDTIADDTKGTESSEESTKEEKKKAGEESLDSIAEFNATFNENCVNDMTTKVDSAKEENIMLKHLVDGKEGAYDLVSVKMFIEKKDAKGDSKSVLFASDKAIATPASLDKESSVDSDLAIVCHNYKEEASLKVIDAKMRQFNTVSTLDGSFNVDREDALSFTDDKIVLSTKLLPNTSSIGEILPLGISDDDSDVEQTIARNLETGDVRVVTVSAEIAEDGSQVLSTRQFNYKKRKVEADRAETAANDEIPAAATTVPQND